jgi:hypothetical protein
MTLQSERQRPQQEQNKRQVHEQLQERETDEFTCA